MSMTRVAVCRESGGREGRSAREMPYLGWGAKSPLALRAVNGYGKSVHEEPNAYIEKPVKPEGLQRTVAKLFGL